MEKKNETKILNAIGLIQFWLSKNPIPIGTKYLIKDQNIFPYALLLLEFQQVI